MCLHWILEKTLGKHQDLVYFVYEIDNIYYLCDWMRDHEKNQRPQNINQNQTTRKREATISISNCQYWRRFPKKSQKQSNESKGCFFWWSPQEIIGFAFLVLLTFKILWQMTKRITYEWLCWFYYYKYLLVFLIRLCKHRHVMVGKTIDFFFLQIVSPQNDLIIHRYGDEWNR